MEKKRLTIMINGFWFGGAQNMVYEQLKNVDTDRYEVSVVSNIPKSTSTLEDQVCALFPVTYLNGGNAVTPKTVFQMVKAIQTTKPDIVHAHLGSVGFAAVWSMLYRKPLVITAHTKPEKAFSPKIEKMVRLALKTKRTKLVAVSEDNAKRLREYFGLDKKLCACVNNGIDLDRFTRKEHDGFTIIHVGRQDENKNQAALIRCFARLHKKYPDTKLLLLGDGDQHKKLIALTQELGLADVVTFTGNVSNTEDYYAVSDLYVQCSHREAMPLSVLEAMATPLPIVSTNVGGLKDVVRDNGILVPDNDEDALYRAMETIYTQAPEERHAMCQASDRIVQGYSSKNMARQYEKIYEEMTKVKKHDQKR